MNRNCTPPHIAGRHFGWLNRVDAVQGPTSKYWLQDEAVGKGWCSFHLPSLGWQMRGEGLGASNQPVKKPAQGSVWLFRVMPVRNTAERKLCQQRHCECRRRAGCLVSPQLLPPGYAPHGPLTSNRDLTNLQVLSHQQCGQWVASVLQAALFDTCVWCLSCTEALSLPWRPPQLPFNSGKC